MTVTRVTMTADKFGPIFDGRAEAELPAFIDGIVRDVTHLGWDMIQARLDVVLKHPTGNYQTHVGTMVLGPAEMLITDHAIVYGPWLEGTSKRNQSTRFKGYHSFRYAFRRVRAAAMPLAQAKLDALIARWNA